MRKFIIFLFILFFVHSCTVFSQTISSRLYENEEDIEEGFLSGELTYDEYIELLDLLREGVAFNSPQKDRLLFLPDLSQSEIDQAPDTSGDIYLSETTLRTYPAAKSFFLPEMLNQTQGRVSIQSRQRFEQDYSYDFILTEFKLKNKLRFNIQLQKEGSSDPLIKKRGLEFSSLPFLKRVVLGNFDKKIGLGLNIGYHPLLKGEELHKENYFLYPLYGRYNGILIESKMNFFSPELILSKNKKGDFSEELWALNLLFSKRRLDFGILRPEGRLRNLSNHSSFYDRNSSFYLKVKKEKYTISSECSFLSSGGKGWASVLTIRDKSYLLELSGWSYTDNYLHLFGAGLSNPDYTYIEIEDLGYEYPSREMGENGIMLKSDYLIYHNLLLNFSYSQWRENNDTPFKLRQKIGFKITLSEKIKTGFEYLHSDYDLKEGGHTQNLFTSTLLFEPQKESSFRLITRYGKRRLSSSTSQKNSFELQLRSDLEWFSPFLLILWVRYKDSDLSLAKNGYWDLRIQESFSLFQGSLFKGEYFIKLNPAEENKVQGAKFWLEVGF
jgi:hypothetical protein